MLRASRDSLTHRDGQQGWDHYPITHDNPRYRGPNGYRLFEERLPLTPFGRTSIPLDNPHPPTRVIIFGNNNHHIISPRFPQPTHNIIPRFINQDTTQERSQSDDASKLTTDEQETVLKKLKKQIYNPMPKILARRVSLYYRDLNKDPNLKATKAKGKEIDEDRKNCAVCLEDFEVREEVMVTPCNHMFHEECIVPWVKNHGQCPVCRAIFYERRENGPVLDNNRPVVRSGGQGAAFADELFSLIQAVDEVFPWGIN